jgi:uncharacterized protein
LRREGAEEIPVEECWDLLRSKSVGRLSLSVGALPQILPVQYYVNGGEIAACLGRNRVQLDALDNVVVAFATDSIGIDASGWTVQVLGLASARLPAKAPAGRVQPDHGPIVDIAPKRITGCRVELHPLDADGAVAARWVVLDP